MRCYIDIILKSGATEVINEPEAQQYLIESREGHFNFNAGKYNEGRSDPAVAFQLNWVHPSDESPTPEEYIDALREPKK